MLLKSLIRVLGEEFGYFEVTKEAISQYDVERVQLVAENLAIDPLSPKITRITAARALFSYGLLEAKNWVEAHFSDNGSGDPI